jgi:hypothetical protein
MDAEIPIDIFRVLIQYLCLEELILLDKTLSCNQNLSFRYRTALDRMTTPQAIDLSDIDPEMMSWINNLNITLEKVECCFLGKNSLDLLIKSRPTLQSMKLIEEFWAPPPQDADLRTLGSFPSLTELSIQLSFSMEAISSFLQLHPQLLLVDISGIAHLSIEIIPRLTQSCPNLCHLGLSDNPWLTDEAIDLLTGRYPKLKFLDISRTNVRDEATLQRLINSCPDLCSVGLPFDDCSTEFLSFFLNQIIFRAIWSSNPKDEILGIEGLARCVDVSSLHNEIGKISF